MKCTILHESRGRLRVHVCNVRMTLHRADVLEAYLNHHDAVSKAKVYERTGDVVVYYTGSRKDGRRRPERLPLRRPRAGRTGHQRRQPPHQSGISGKDV